MAERKIAYEALNHKSNAGFRVQAPSLQRLYIDAGLALTDQLVRLDQIKDPDRKTISAQGDNRENLMVNWLNEILKLFEKDKFLSKRIVFNLFDGKKISAVLFGETYIPVKHGYASKIKTVTLEQLELGMGGESDHPFYAKVFLEG